jgi:heme-degrading monooxygenase HmoA
MNKFFCIICILLFISKTENVFSNNLIYDVNNVEIRGETNNKATSRKLIEKAFEKAFGVFIDKTLLREDALKLYKTQPEIIKDLVLTYQIIQKEKTNNKETLSTYNIKFDPKKINNFLAEKGISYADISNISLTLLPILIIDKNIFLYEKNFFYKNWIRSKGVIENTNDKLITYNLALENIEDLEYINNFKDSADLIDIKKIDSFKESTNYALLVIYSTEDKFKAFIKTSINNKAINRNIELNFYTANKKKSYEEAVTIIKKEIKQIWKEQNLIDASITSFLDCFLEIKNIDDYLKFKSILDSIDIIENYSVLEITNKHLKIRIKYKGKVNKIKDKLTKQKVNIRIEDNVWKLIIK